jgi:pyruvate kinase
MTRPVLCRAKIVATLGPASSDAATIRALADAGADVFRLNFSLGSHAEHRARDEINLLRIARVPLASDA